MYAFGKSQKWMERLEQNTVYQQKHVERGSSEHCRSAVLITWPSYNSTDYCYPGVSQWWDTWGFLSSLVYINHVAIQIKYYCTVTLSTFFKTTRFVGWVAPPISAHTVKHVKRRGFIDFTSIMMKFQYFAPVLLFRWGVLLKLIVNTSLKQKPSGFLISNYLTAWLK